MSEDRTPEERLLWDIFAGDAEAPLALDPEPWHCPGADPKYRIKHGEQLQCDEFTPRPGYSQNQEDYES